RRHTRFSRDWSSDVCSSDLSFLKLSGGPPAAKPISVKVRADDFDELRAAAAALKQAVAAIPGARDVTDNDVAGRAELNLRVDVEIGRASCRERGEARGVAVG